MDRMSTLWGVVATITFVALTPVFADNHDNPENPTVAMQAHYCTLNSGKDMADVDQALAPWRRWKEETNWNGWTAEVTPQFDIVDGPDFYWLNFAPFDYTGDVLEEFAVSGGKYNGASTQWRPVRLLSTQANSSIRRWKNQRLTKPKSL